MSITRNYNDLVWKCMKLKEEERNLNGKNKLTTKRENCVMRNIKKINERRSKKPEKNCFSKRKKGNKLNILMTNLSYENNERKQFFFRSPQKNNNEKPKSPNSNQQKSKKYFTTNIQGTSRANGSSQFFPGPLFQRKLHVGFPFFPSFSFFSRSNLEVMYVMSDASLNFHPKKGAHSWWRLGPQSTQKWTTGKVRKMGGQMNNFVFHGKNFLWHKGMWIFSDSDWSLWPIDE